MKKYLNLTLRFRSELMLSEIEALRANIALGLIFVFLVNTLGPLPLAQAQDFHLPAPGVMIQLSPEFNPPILKGIKVHPDNPFRFDFILDRGDSLPLEGKVREGDLKQEATKLIKYFLASLTIPEQDLWVNLSPYEKNRIIPPSFGLTEMGRDLLAEDYMLKQITASLIYPEGDIGKKFWKRIYEKAAKKYGTTNIPVNTFNKVWIVPEKAVVYENAKAGTAYVVESKLKVMLEQDYLSLAMHEGIQSGQVQNRDTNQIGSQIVREIVIPELTKEVNENKNFFQLRQVYNSLILATWYKKKIKDSLLEQVYADKNKVAGVNIDDPKETQKIYQRYLLAFKKGVYNYIKEEAISIPGMPSKEQGIFPRKYFSGGENLSSISRTELVLDEAMATTHKIDLPQISSVKPAFLSDITVDFQMSSLQQKNKAMITTKNFFKRDKIDWIIVGLFVAALSMLPAINFELKHQGYLPEFIKEHRLGLKKLPITQRWFTNTPNPTLIYGELNVDQDFYPSKLSNNVINNIYVLNAEKFHEMASDDSNIDISRFDGIDFSENPKLDPNNKNGYWEKVRSTEGGPILVKLRDDVSIIPIYEGTFTNMGRDRIISILKEASHGEDGQYFDGTRSIILHLGNAKNPFILAHELGHPYWEHALDDPTRQELISIYRDNRFGFSKVSKWASESNHAEEAFCEMLMTLVKNPKDIRELNSVSVLKPFVREALKALSWKNSEGVTVIRSYHRHGDLVSFDDVKLPRGFNVKDAIAASEKGAYHTQLKSGEKRSAGGSQGAKNRAMLSHSDKNTEGLRKFEDFLKKLDEGYFDFEEVLDDPEAIISEYGYNVPNFRKYLNKMVKRLRPIYKRYGIVIPPGQVQAGYDVLEAEHIPVQRPSAEEEIDGFIDYLSIDLDSGEPFHFDLVPIEDLRIIVGARTKEFDEFFEEQKNVRKRGQEDIPPIRAIADNVFRVNFAKHILGLQDVEPLTREIVRQRVGQLDGILMPYLLHSIHPGLLTLIDTMHHAYQFAGSVLIQYLDKAMKSETIQRKRKGNRDRVMATEIKYTGPKAVKAGLKKREKAFLENNATALQKTKAEGGDKTLYEAAKTFGVPLPRKAYEDNKPTEEQAVQELIQWAIGHRASGITSITSIKLNSILEEYPKLSREMAVRVLSSEGIGIKDKAMARTTSGGIDLTSANMHFKTQNNGRVIKFYMDPAMFKQLQNAPGFVPVIINIQPMTNLREFLGLNQTSQA